jgi:hypothetical protein
VWRERKNGVKEKERRKVVLVRVVVVLAFFELGQRLEKDRKNTGKLSSVLLCCVSDNSCMYVSCVCVCWQKIHHYILPLVRVFISFVFSHVCHTHTSKSSINKGLNIL